MELVPKGNYNKIWDHSIVEKYKFKEYIKDAKFKIEQIKEKFGFG